jgi:hypothetical protein
VNHPLADHPVTLSVLEDIRDCGSHLAPQLDRHGEALLVHCYLVRPAGVPPGSLLTPAERSLQIYAPVLVGTDHEGVVRATWLGTGRAWEPTRRPPAPT